MAANTTPIFVGTPNVGFARLNYTNQNSDGSGTQSLIFTSGVNGSRIDEIRVHNSAATPSNTTDACVVRIFVATSSTTGLINGYTSSITPAFLVDEIAISSTARSTSAVGASGFLSYPGGLIMASGSNLWACMSIYNSANFDALDVIVRGGNF